MATGLSLAVRPLTEADLERVVEIEAVSFAEPWPRHLFEGELAQPSRIYRAVERRGSICGFGGLMIVGEDAHIVTLAVVPHERRQGVGSLLMVSLIEAARERGARNLTLEVRRSNDVAQQLYRKFGFEEVGLRRDYYRTEDAVVMWAVDIDSNVYQDTLEAMRSVI